MGLTQTEEVDKAEERMVWRNKMAGGEGRTAVRIKPQVVGKIEQQIEGRVGEVILAPEMRSSSWMVEPTEMHTLGCKAIILNRLIERKELKQKESQNTKETKTIAAAKGIVVIMIDTIAQRGAANIIKLSVKRIPVLQNPLAPRKPDMGIRML